MRPIDADALEYTLGCSDRDIYVKAYLDEDAPTIDVIPIDWIKKKIEEHKDNPFQDVYDAFRTVLTIWEHETEGKR